MWRACRCAAVYIHLLFKLTSHMLLAHSGPLSIRELSAYKRAQQRRQFKKKKKKKLIKISTAYSEMCTVYDQ